MKIHEYQAKALLSKYGIKVPRGIVLRISDSPADVLRRFGEGPLVVKAQIHAGGRGKAGGIRIVHDGKELEGVSRELLGYRLVTAQTGPEGNQVNTLLVEESLNISREIYIGITIDRTIESIILLASTEGGMEIERIAVEKPQAILKETIHPGVGLRPFQSRRIAFGLQLETPQRVSIEEIVAKLYRFFLEKDCSVAEINPLVVTDSGELVALDAKVVVDDNALFRHPDIAELRDDEQENELEAEATKNNLSYVKLRGNVGCLVNGAGLAMATMDLIKLAGAAPANFLDVGGGATSEMIEHGFRIILDDSDVRAIFINIFGGILRCDTLAKGVVKAASNLRVSLPIIVRLEGTNVEEGRRILSRSGLSLLQAESLADAASKVRDALEI